MKKVFALGLLMMMGSVSLATTGAGGQKACNYYLVLEERDSSLREAREDVTNLCNDVAPVIEARFESKANCVADYLRHDGHDDEILATKILFKRKDETVRKACVPAREDCLKAMALAQSYRPNIDQLYCMRLRDYPVK